MPEPSTAWSVWSPDWRRNLRALKAAGALDRLPPPFRRLVAAHPFLAFARDMQAPPPGRWPVWLLSGGRGAGKTRAGAEWARYAVLQGGCRRLALVGPTFAEAREVMIEGPSGLVWTEPRPDQRPRWQPSRQRLEWPNGAVAYAFSAEDPDALRGPQFEAAWCDEAGAWTRGEAAWDMLQFTLRLGTWPRAVVTTTPRPVPLIRRLMSLPGARLSRMPTADNAGNLAPGFLTAMEAAYGGTALGRQELHGELIDDPPGALFARADIDAMRRPAPARLEDCVVAVDPAVSSRPGADACGIVAAGTAGGRAYVLADASAPGLAPLDWAERAAWTAEVHGASVILAEANQGGEMVRQMLEMAGASVPVRLVTARLGKRGRAGPVAALYAQGRVSHTAAFPALEDQMCRFGAEGFSGSPDRVDALVWALWALMIEGRGPRVRVVM